MKLTILLFALALVAYAAQEPVLPTCGSTAECPTVTAKQQPKIDPALAYQTARADAAEAALAVANRTIRGMQQQAAAYMAAINYCAEDWGNQQALAAKAAEAQKALDKLKEGKP